jgi:uncharacterized membrane protein
MKHLLSFLTLTIISFKVFSQSANDSLQEVASKSSGTPILEILMNILIVCVVVFMIVHMVYILVKSRQFAKQDYNVDFFKSFRLEKGMPAESSEQDNERCVELLGEAFETWTNIEPDEEGNEYRKPKKMNEIIKSGAFLQQIIAIAPTDEEIITNFNEYKEVVCTNEARSFDGSWKLVGLGVAVAVIISLMMMSNYSGFFAAFFSVGLIFLIPTLIYIVSSYTPQFLIEKRAKRGGGNVSSGIVAMALGVLGGGYTIRTKYSDGSSEDDSSPHFIALFLGVILMVIVAMTIGIWAFVNYLRNFVLFF